MTKQGSFKRAVRQRARETGVQYTQARAAMAKGETAEAPDRPFEQAALKAHLEDRYGIRIASMEAIDGHQPATLRVHREDGPDWVARIFSNPADEISAVEGDAEVLQFLANQDFPAERVAHEEPVSVLEGNGVLVTEFVEGGSPFSWTNPQLVTPAVQLRAGGAARTPAYAARSGWRYGPGRRFFWGARSFPRTAASRSCGGYERPGECGRCRRA